MGDVIKVDSLSFCVKSAFARAFLINYGISRILPSLLPLSEPSLGIERPFWSAWASKCQTSLFLFQGAGLHLRLFGTTWMFVHGVSSPPQQA
jgi:hypothetical protein